MKWHNTNTLVSRKFTCGHCSNIVASNEGYYATFDKFPEILCSIYICTHCKKPTIFFSPSEQIPNECPGNSVEGLGKEIALLYEEARQCISVSSYTASVMLCRKILMHIAVEKGAEENETFKHYVDYLDKRHFLPIDSKDWIDHIRKKGNDANHKIVISSKKDAMELIEFIEILTKIIYEFPNRVSKHQLTDKNKQS